MSDLPPVKLKEWRIAKRKGLRQLARESGLDFVTLYLIEQGKTKRPHPGTVEKLADALGITPFDLYRLPADEDNG